MTENKVVLITGAAKRLGANTARHLHAAGYNIVIHYHRSKTDADRLVETLNQQRENSAHGIPADLIHDDLAVLANAAQQQWGRLDVLINNASSFYPTPLSLINQQHWDELVGTNFKAPLLLSQHCAEYIQQSNGCIINMIDIYHEKALYQHTVYTAAKAALASLTCSLALELAPKARVNGVAPGAILWPEQSDSGHESAILEKIPMQRIGDANDIAQAIQFLIEAPYITGQIINVDGGRSLQM